MRWGQPGADQEHLQDTPLKTWPTIDVVKITVLLSLRLAEGSYQGGLKTFTLLTFAVEICCWNFAVKICCDDFQKNCYVACCLLLVVAVAVAEILALTSKYAMHIACHVKWQIDKRTQKRVQKESWKVATKLKSCYEFAALWCGIVTMEGCQEDKVERETFK